MKNNNQESIATSPFAIFARRTKHQVEYFKEIGQTKKVICCLKSTYRCF